MEQPSHPGPLGSTCRGSKASSSPSPRIWECAPVVGKEPEDTVTSQLVSMCGLRGFPPSPGFLLGHRGTSIPHLTGRMAGHGKCSVNKNGS